MIKGNTTAAINTPMLPASPVRFIVGIVLAGALVWLISAINTFI
jgi:hypothetical protein